MLRAAYRTCVSKYLAITRQRVQYKANGHVSLRLRVRWGGAVRGGPVNFHQQRYRQRDTQPKLQVDIICYIRSDFTRNI